MTTILQADQLDARRPGFGDAASDADLVARARLGDDDAFGELIQRHSRQVYGLLTRVMGDLTIAEDVLQDTFLKAWRGLPGFRGDAKFSTWLFRIAMNEANSRLTREVRRDTRPFDETMADIPDLAVEPFELVEADELRICLEGCIRRLPLNYRTPVVLRDIQGLSNQEAAEVLGITVRNFKSRLHRGRMAVRRGLEAFVASRDGDGVCAEAA